MEGDKYEEATSLEGAGASESPLSSDDDYHDAPTDCYLDSNMLSKHLERQAMILSKLSASSLSSEDVASPGKLLEKALFTPKDRPQNSEPDPRLNFYPPFLTPECLALHYPFFMNLPIPRSCKANRVGTQTLEDMLEQEKLPSFVPVVTNVQWSDEIGNVDLIADLKEMQKFALMKDDNVRLRWFKSKAIEMKTFAYPCIALPPAIHKTLLEVFIGRSQGPNETETYKPAIADSTFAAIWGKQRVQEGKEAVTAAVTQQIVLRCMQRFFSDKQAVKNIQESLHYTFCHGFVKMIQLLTDTDLSEFVTYHGLTHRNRLNNSSLHRQLEESDKRDYLLDTIYLFLVFTWQTAMDIWQQTLNDETLAKMRQILEKEKRTILKGRTVFKITNGICDIIYPDIIHKTFTSNLPDFISQSQINAFRLFVLSKSGVPQCISPMLPSDAVPCAFTESHPVLWGHVMLLRLAAYFLNHGSYMTEGSGISSVLCECNLCSPQRMPAYNTALMQEITSINRVNIQQSKEDGSEATFSLTPQNFANAYIQRPILDFFHDRVRHFKDSPSDFKQPMEACVIKNTKLLAALKEAEMLRERELLKRGRGVYLDPETGENLTDGFALESAEENAGGERGEAVQAADERQGPSDAVALASTAQRKRGAKSRR